MRISRNAVIRQERDVPTLVMLRRAEGAGARFPGGGKLPRPLHGLAGDGLLTRDCHVNYMVLQ